jgi:hypothetical protein
LIPDRPRCAAESLSRDEPLRATASLVSAWLLIEQPGAWGPDALADSKFPSGIAAELERRSRGVRILLIRHRTASSDEPIFFKAYSGGGGDEPSLVSQPLSDPSALLEIDFEGLARGDLGPGTPIEHPVYLVCTHGRHDVCCADNGRPLYRAMSELRPDRTWEVSHLGGDRFAGNLLVLPRGDYFGRLERQDAEPLISAYESGRLSLAHYRGRSIQPRLVQAAEHFVRESEGLTGFDDLAVAEYRRYDGDRAEVVFSASDGPIRVHVVAHRLTEAAFLTCRADQPGYPVEYELVSQTRV